MQFTITVCHDEKEGVWFVQTSDVPGLNAEAGTLDALVDVISDLAPDLVAANLPGTIPGDGSPIELCVQHVVNARIADAA
jgi:predicted RNase H-like HicB family nuclease